MIDENDILPLHFFLIIIIYISFFEMSAAKIICQVKKYVLYNFAKYLWEHFIY